MNTDGGYKCDCRDGFFILSDNKTCQGKIVIEDESGNCLQL